MSINQMSMLCKLKIGGKSVLQPLLEPQDHVTILESLAALKGHRIARLIEPSSRLATCDISSQIH